MNDMIPVLKSIKMFDDQMVEVVYNDNVKVTVKGVDEVYELLDEVTRDRKVLKLMVIGKGVEITNDARQYIVEQNIKRKDFIIAEAIVVNSIAQKISANIYISFIARIYPTHFFTDIDKAREWLLRQLTEATTR